MEEIVRRLSSPSSSLSSPTESDDFATRDTSASGWSHEMKSELASLEALPAEIITQILTCLSSTDLVALSLTSHLLRSHAHNDLLWMSLVKENIPDNEKVTSPAPAAIWRELYIVHHPYWFLVRQRLWFGDADNAGSFVLVRYNHQESCIEGHQLLGEHGVHATDFWQHNPEVMVHTFNPHLKLWLNDPVLKLDYHHRLDGSRLQKEVPMHIGSRHGVRSMISLCQAIPKDLQNPSMALWPPSTVPSVSRVRNESPNKFRTRSHRPQSLDVMSDQAFRVRKYLEFSNLLSPLNAVRVGEEVTTFSTLSTDLYRPTEQKPWQGLWVGDYSGHGCEFLLVLQREVSTAIKLTPQSSTGDLPEGMSIAEMEAETTEEGLPTFQPLTSGDLEVGPSAAAHAGDSSAIDAASFTELGSSAAMKAEDNISEAFTEPSSTGRLEAVKLTGDINVPRGQHTWIAEDIGSKGLIRIAEEQPFTGARIVKSWGRIAGRGFKHDRFIPSQLILISHDTLAQYWIVSRPRS